MSISNEDLARAYQRGQLAALGALWMQVKQLAWWMVSRFLSLAKSNKAVDSDDLMQAAFLGVERAAKAFNPELGSFATIMGYYLSDECREVLGLNGRKRLEHYNAESTNKPISETGDLTIVDTIPDDSLTDEDAAILRDDVQRLVHAAIDCLKQQEATVIRASFLEGVPYGVISQRLGVSETRVGYLRHRGLQKMQDNQCLRQLVDDACCWKRKGVRAFRSNWSSVVEDAVLWREKQDTLRVINDIHD